MTPLKDNIMVEMEVLGSEVIELAGRKKTNIGTVIAVGPKVRELEKGNRVILPQTFSDNAPDAYILMKENEVLGLLCE